MELEVIFRNWWSYLLRGLVAVIFAILLLAWPGATLKAFMVIIGIFLLLDGFINMIRSAVLAGRREKWGWSLIWGLAGIIIGIIIISHTRFTLEFVATLAGIWVLLMGIAEIALAFDMPPESGRGIVAVLGIISIAFGIIIIATPFGTIYALSVVFAIYLIVVGALDVVLSYYVRKMQKGVEKAVEEA
jgi:uncharacterized membrane protein HdeD (DUF308 family)